MNNFKLTLETLRTRSVLDDKFELDDALILIDVCIKMSEKLFRLEKKLDRTTK